MRQKSIVALKGVWQLLIFVAFSTFISLYNNCSIRDEVESSLFRLCFARKVVFNS